MNIKYILRALDTFKNKTIIKDYLYIEKIKVIQIEKID